MYDKSPLGSIMVIGGCGNLGSRLVNTLLQRQLSSKLCVLDLNIPSNPNSKSLVTYHVCDITQKEDVRSIFQKTRPHVIFHTASPPPMLKDLNLFLRVNVTGTRNLLECAQEIGCVKVFVYTSSASVVHDADGDLHNGDETYPLVFLPQQKEVYSHTKALADQLVLASNRRGQMRTVSLRPSGIFGENDGLQVKALVDSAAAGKFKVQIGNGKNLFDFTYIDNLVDAEILAAQKLLNQSDSVPDEERVDGEAFTVTNDEPVPFWSYSRAIGAAAGYPTDETKIKTIPRWVGMVLATLVEWFVWVISFGRRRPVINTVVIKYSTMERTYNIDKIKKRLGYRPRVSMQEGIRRSGASFHKDKRDL
ncbi:hypothetical protein G7Y89_g9154 [Cudoniella acicularis]|uniref:3-beta hydroxysteroid dehydrogenase/isomerase domain-containing protein n=1 Tax=Cudoniella acicularis TaxID=354080 RepID=A0A8H4RF75_9HELO|nr:hypothetical protein G7Y89_g9154 [Cudoniella acicularis]